MSLSTDATNMEAQQVDTCKINVHRHSQDGSTLETYHKWTDLAALYRKSSL